MSWEYGDPILLGDTELEIGSVDYNTWAELAEILTSTEYDDEE